MIGYGVDTYCLAELQTGRLVGGRTRLVQSIYHRLTTPRGTLQGGPEESAYGLDLAGWVGSVGTAVAVAALPSLVEAELSKDSRVESVACTVSRAVSSGRVALTVRVAVTPVDEGEDFALTLAVSDVSVELIGGLS
ncbi:MAG: hypothetical protein A2Y78_00180 [Acidobacteria bacterium RBG_13_68_16]|nr:MAG: hypothetical protein A2Y78_00180 [Acidobacteria bacterium RBG_13_68_16]